MYTPRVWGLRALTRRLQCIYDVHPTGVGVEGKERHGIGGALMTKCVSHGYKTNMSIIIPQHTKNSQIKVSSLNMISALQAGILCNYTFRGRVRCGLVRYGRVWLGSVRLRLGLVRRGKGKEKLACL